MSFNVFALNLIDFCHMGFAGFKAETHDSGWPLPFYIFLERKRHFCSMSEKESKALHICAKMMTSS